MFLQELLSDQKIESLPPQKRNENYFGCGRIFYDSAKPLTSLAGMVGQIKDPHVESHIICIVKCKLSSYLFQQINICVMKLREALL